MLVSSTGFPNKDFSSYLVRSTDSLDKKVRLAASIIFQYCYSILTFCDSVFQYWSGCSITTIFPKIVAHFVTDSIKTDISGRQKKINQTESLTWNFLLAKMAIKTSTYSVILFLFSRSIPHLFSLHKQSKNSLKYLYFIYQLYTHIDLIRVFGRGEVYYLECLDEMRSTLEQLQKKYTFDKILINQNQELVRAWFKDHGKTLSNESIDKALTKFFPATLSIHDLTISLDEKQFREWVIPKINYVITKTKLIKTSIQNFQLQAWALEITTKKQAARNLFNDLNIYSQDLFKIKTQLEQVPTPSEEIQDLLVASRELYESIEPQKNPSYMDESPRNTLLDFIFEGFGRPNPKLIFDGSEEPWVVLFAGGADPFSLILPIQLPFSTPQHPIEQVRRFLDSLGLKTVEDLKNQRILTTNETGTSTVSVKYFLLGFSKNLLQPIFNAFLRNKTLWIEGLTEKFLLNTNFTFLTSFKDLYSQVK